MAGIIGSVAYVVNDTAVALVGGIFLDGIAYSIVVELVGAEYYSCTVLAEVLEFIEAILLADASVGDFFFRFLDLGSLCYRCFGYLSGL